jgi:acetyltransferase-like isoleucine patch superfamily enzyme
MNMLFKISKLLRRLPGAIWRRVLSKPVKFILNNCYGVRFGRNTIFVGWPVLKGEGSIQLGHNCVLVSSPLGNPLGLFRPCIIEAISSHSRIHIGDNFGASGVCIVAEKEITIGNNVSVGANATIIDTDFHAINADARNSHAAANSKPIRIEDDVWIGMNALILKGVTLHRGAVIGANAVVTKDVPAGARAVGNPARIIFDGSGIKLKAIGESTDLE